MIKKVLTILFSVAILFFTFTSYAQQEETLTLSIEQAQKFAIEHNYLIKNASLEIKKAEATKWYAISTMLPQVNGTLDYTSMLGYEMVMKIPGKHPITGEDIVTEMRIPSKPTSNLTIQAGVAVSGVQIVSATLGKLVKEMAQTNSQKTELNIKAQVRTVYFSILAMDNILSLLEKSMENMLFLEKCAQQAVKVGVSEQTDADQLSVQVSLIQNNINSTKRSLEILYNSLRLLLGASAETKILLTETIDNVLNIDYANRLLNESFLIVNNLDYQLVELNTQLAKKQLRISEWSYGPTLSAFYQYKQKIQSSNFDMNPPNLVGLTLNVPIFSSGNKFAKVSEAKCTYKMSLNTLEMLKDQLNMQSKQLRYELYSTMENYETQQKNIEVSQRVINSISNKYEHGIVSSMEVTYSNMNFITAQSNYVKSMLDLINAQIELEKLLNK